jgi:hypothetical protein
MPVSGTLFHAPVPELRGEALLPLNTLRERFPDIYAREHNKYVGREHILTTPVEPLSCTWADVVFFSPVPPDVLFEAIRASGRKVRSGQPWTVDALDLDSDRCCIRLMRVEPGQLGCTPPDQDDWLPFTTATLRAVSEVTVRAVERLMSLNATEPMLPWGDVPHVLHRGPVRIDLVSR